MRDPSADNSSVSPELQILVCCARRTLREKDKARLCEDLPRVLAPEAWRNLLDLADEHGLVPLLHHHLNGCARQNANEEAIPPAQLADLNLAARKHTLMALAQCAALASILERLAEKGIPVVTYKGPALAQRAYGSTTLRQYVDVDLVVPQRVIPALCAEMEALGFAQRFAREHITDRAGPRVPGEYAFAKARDGILAEVHTEFTLRHFIAPPPIEEMLARSQTIPLNGRKAPVFAVEDLLLMLAVHGAKDFWARLVWVADVAEIAGSLTPENWRILLERACEWRIGRMLHIALALAREIYELEPPEGIVREIESDRTALRVSADLREQLLQRTPLPEGIVARSRYRIAMAESFSKGLRYWIRLSTAPAQDDWQPETSGKLRSRSYLSRPLRLWRKYRS